MQRFQAFHLHGDNIVECERAVGLIRQALQPIGWILKGPHGSPVCPSFEITYAGAASTIAITLYPGFSRWNLDILDLVRRRGGTLREAADVIITGVADGYETPLLAIEYCGALPAGNQAWQRSGRAHSFGKAQIPYLYVAELGGYELDRNRRRKAPRLPNPAVAFSYLAFTLTNRTPIFPVFITSPGADAISRSVYADVFGDDNLLVIIRNIFVGGSNDAAMDSLRTKALYFVEKRAASCRRGTTLTPEQWKEAYERLVSHGSLVDFLVTSARLPWAKVAYIDALTESARSLMNLTAEIAIGLTSSDLPMCIVPRQSRPAFATAVQRLGEGRIQREFLEWLRRDHPLSVCWVMGFKPRGDDARPDRGLPPLTRMLAGKNADLLTVV